MRYRASVRRQKPVKGGRRSLHPCVIKEIEREVERRAARFNASKSFVVAVALAESFGISLQETSDEHL